MKRFPIHGTTFAVLLALALTGLAGCSVANARPETGPAAATSAAAAASAPTAAAAPPAGPAALAGPATLAGPGSPVASRTDSMKVGARTRSWVVFTPRGAALPASAPLIVELSGIGNTVSVESSRNRLLPYVAAGKAELVYPVAVERSWNAGGCCGAAGAMKVDDVGFLEKLVPRIDPGHKRPVYFVGYSNGGRLLYTLECADPGLFDGMAAVKSDPMPGCVVSRPQTVLVVSARDDPAVPYEPGVKGRESPPASVQVARLKQALGCTDKPVPARHGDMTLTTWSSCRDGKRLGWALYATGGHNFPPPTAGSPSGAQVIWSFFTGTALAPLPR
jgi:polyhydroxybutyrate depolymerase